MSTAPNHVLPREREDKVIVYARASAGLHGLTEQVNRCLLSLASRVAGVQIIGSGLPATAVDPKLATAVNGNIDMIVIESLDRLPAPQRRRVLQAAANGEFRLVAVGDHFDSAKPSH